MRIMRELLEGFAHVMMMFLILESCVRTCKQREVGRKMASISSSECESVPEPEIESSQSTSIPETSSEASSSTASSLLDRLRSPRPSDLARKRQVKCNPPRGSRRGKGKVTADPKTVSPSDRVKAYPGENFTVNKKNLFCRGCREELALKKSVIEHHIQSQKHERGKENRE